MTRFNAWVNVVNTTSLRIITSIFVTALLLLLLMVAVLFFRFEPSAGQMKLLYAMGGLLAVMMSLDVAQFIGKRFSDAGYAAAKQGPASVTVEAPSTVTVAPTPPPVPGSPTGAPSGERGDD